MEMVTIPEEVAVVLEVRRLPEGRSRGVMAKPAFACEDHHAAVEHLLKLQQAHPQRCYIWCLVHPRYGLRFGQEDVEHVNAVLGTALPPGRMVMDHVSAWGIWAAAVGLVAHCCEDAAPRVTQQGDAAQGDVPHVR